MSAASAAPLEHVITRNASATEATQPNKIVRETMLKNDIVVWIVVGTSETELNPTSQAEEVTTLRTRGVHTFGT